ncbi:MAG TPA: hypothetical protein VIV57_20885 [Anaeromyxobacter sp.]
MRVTGCDRCFRGFDETGAACVFCGGTQEIPAERRRMHRRADGPRGNDGAVVVGGASECELAAVAPARRATDEV